MEVKSPVNLAAILHFKEGVEGITHFKVHPNGSVECFSVGKCSTGGCECMIQDGNQIVFSNVGKMVGLFLIARLEPSEAEADYGMDDDGNVFCLPCYEKLTAAK